MMIGGGGKVVSKLMCHASFSIPGSEEEFPVMNLRFFLTTDALRKTFDDLQLQQQQQREEAAATTFSSTPPAHAYKYSLYPLFTESVEMRPQHLANKTREQILKVFFHEPTFLETFLSGGGGAGAGGDKHKHSFARQNLAVVLHFLFRGQLDAGYTHPRLHNVHADDLRVAVPHSFGGGGGGDAQTHLYIKHKLYTVYQPRVVNDSDVLPLLKDLVGKMRVVCKERRELNEEIVYIDEMLRKFISDHFGRSKADSNNKIWAAWTALMKNLGTSSEPQQRRTGFMIEIDKINEEINQYWGGTAAASLPQPRAVHDMFAKIQNLRSANASTAGEKRITIDSVLNTAVIELLKKFVEEYDRRERLVDLRTSIQSLAAAEIGDENPRAWEDLLKKLSRHVDLASTNRYQQQQQHHHHLAKKDVDSFYKCFQNMRDLHHYFLCGGDVSFLQGLFACVKASKNWSDAAQDWREVDRNEIMREMRKHGTSPIPFFFKRRTAGAGGEGQQYHDIYLFVDLLEGAAAYNATLRKKSKCFSQKESLIGTWDALMSELFRYKDDKDDKDAEEGHHRRKTKVMRVFISEREQQQQQQQRGQVGGARRLGRSSNNRRRRRRTRRTRKQKVGS